MIFKGFGQPEAEILQECPHSQHEAAGWSLTAVVLWWTLADCLKSLNWISSFTGSGVP